MTSKFEVSSELATTWVAHFFVIKDNSSYEEKEKKYTTKKIEEKTFILYLFIFIWVLFLYLL